MQCYSIICIQSGQTIIRLECNKRNSARTVVKENENNNHFAVFHQAGYIQEVIIVKYFGTPERMLATRAEIL